MLQGMSFVTSRVIADGGATQRGADEVSDPLLGLSTASDRLPRTSCSLPRDVCRLSKASLSL